MRKTTLWSVAAAVSAAAPFIVRLLSTWST